MEEHRGRFAHEPGLSVIIPTHNRSSLLLTTLERLTASSLRGSWEIVVVADACTDDTVTAVAELAGDVDVPIRIVEELQPSASVARNRGAQAASGSLLVFLDDDILLERDALATIEEWYEDSDRVTLLVGQTVQLPEHSATPFGAFRERFLGGGPAHGRPDEVDWYASGLAAVPAGQFRLLGGYAEDYPAAGLEDADFAIRVRRAGYQIIFHPGVTALHNDWAGSTARDFCRRAAGYCTTAPLLAARFPDNDHPWRELVEVNRPPVPADTRLTRVRKRLKLIAVALAADRWLPVLADCFSLPRRPRELLYRVSVSLAMFAGYQRGLRRLAQIEEGASQLSEGGPLTPKELSIVIVTFNCGDEVERAIEALQRHPPSIRHEILVADNASNDGTAERLGRRFPQVSVIEVEENIGYGSAVNLAAKEATGDHLLLLNPDTEVTAGAIDALLWEAETMPRAGVLGPRLLLGSGAPQASARRIPSPWRLWFEVLRFHLLLPPSARSRLLGGVYSAQDKRGRVDWVSGACHLIPRPVWDALGGLTERTFCGFDDLDFCWRARDAGFETWFCPEALILHHCGVSVSRRWTSRQVDTLAIHNIYVVLEDHWPRSRVKLYCAAEVVGTVSDLVLGARRSGLSGSAADDYRTAARERLALLMQLLLDRVRPIERHEPGRLRIGYDN